MSVLSVVDSSARVIRRGSLTLDLDRCIVQHAGVLVSTTLADFSILRTLMIHRNVPMNRDVLARMVFGPGHGRDPRQMDVFVARLRRSLAAAGADLVICTVAGRGYAVMDQGEGSRHPDVMQPFAGTNDLLVA